MKILDPNFLSHLQQEVTTLCWCWRIVRTDNQELGFTNFDQDLTFAGLTYKASASFSPSAFAADNTMAVNNLEVNSILDNDAISEADLIGGKYDNAKILIFIVNYLDLPESLTFSLGYPLKLLMLINGQFGQIINTGTDFKAEIRSKSQYLNLKQSILTSKSCRYELGDSQCTVNLASYTHNLTIASVTGMRTFTINQSFEENYFYKGFVTFTSGNNSGKSYLIRSHNGNNIELLEIPSYPLTVGTTLTAIAGCDRTLEACKRFNNSINFGGEPHLPGFDKYLAGYE